MNCLPHAQMEQQSPDDVFNSMKAQATEMLSPFMVVAGATTVSMPSTYPAFHLCEPCEMPEEACMTPGGPSCGREFAHIHTLYRPDDDPFVVRKREQGARWQSYQGGGQGSLHMCLTLRDAAAVLSSGWGEPHLLAGQEMAPGMCVPRGLVLVYAPRNLDEVSTVIGILKASLQFARSGTQLPQSNAGYRSCKVRNILTQVDRTEIGPPRILLGF